MTTMHRRPPVIPEVAKAYQNDPRTQLAVTALANGSAGTPVAQGGYAWADGIARVLQGALGGYMNRKQMDAYRGDEDKTIADQQAILAKTQGAAPAPTPPPPGSPAAPAAAPVAPPIPAAAAAQLSPQTAPSAPQMAPAAVDATGQGGGLAGRLPFGSAPASPAASADQPSLKLGVLKLRKLGATVTSGYRTPEHNAEVHGVPNSYHTRGTPDDPMAYDLVPPKGMTMAELAEHARATLPGYKVLNEGNHVHIQPTSSAAAYTHAPADGAVSPGAFLAQAPQPEPVPEMPAPVAKPAMPEAVGPTRSRLLDAAYATIMNGNPYLFSSGRDMFQKGMADQTDLDESAAQRKQRLIDMGYQTDQGIYAHGTEADRDAAIRAREGVVSHNRELADKYDERQFNYGVHKEDQAFETAKEDKRYQRDLALENVRQRAMTERAAGDPIDEYTISQMARQALEGDTSVFTGLGRGQAGLRNMLALRKEMYRQGAALGITPAEIAATNAEFFGRKAEARAIGTRVGGTDVAAAEVPGLAAEAVRTHAALKTTALVPWNKALQMFQNHTSSPELSRAVTAQLALTNAYARSFGTGILSDHARKEAAEQLSVAWGTPAYESAVDQILRNITAERAGAKSALDDIGNRPAPAAAATPGSVPKRKPGETIDQYLQRTGG